MKLKCVAMVGDFFLKTNEVFLFNNDKSKYHAQILRSALNGLVHPRVGPEVLKMSPWTKVKRAGQ